MNLLLRALEPEDLEALYQIENSMEDWEFSATTVPFSRYILREYIINQKCDLYVDRQVRLVICDRDNTSHIIGFADLSDYNPQHRRAEIGIIIMREFRSKGYAIQAIELLVEYAKSTRLVDHLYAYVSEDNVSCIRLLTECGFEQTSILKKWFVKDEKKTNAVIFQFFL